MTIDNKDASCNSKWSTVYFRTSAQQLFDTPSESDIADRSVTMTWKAGETATVIKAFMVDADNNESLAVEQNISAQEIEAGVVTEKGLQPETKYIIRLYNGEKKRGEKTITTIADLNGATLVHEADDFRAMIEAAEDGQVFALYGGTHFIADEDEEGKTGAAKVAKSIVIKGIYPTNIPVVKGRFEILDGASLELNVLDTEGKTNMFIDESGKTVENPNYKDAANGDFTIGNEDVKKLGVGDPRWR